MPAEWSGPGWLAGLAATGAFAPMWSDPEFSFADDRILAFCAASPGQRGNGIACASRRFNIVWRRILRSHVARHLSDAAKYLGVDGHGARFLIHDAMDLLSMMR